MRVNTTSAVSMRVVLIAACVSMLSLSAVQHARAGSYVFAGEANGIELVTHPIGYNGSGGVLNVTVGVDNTSVHAAQMAIPTQNVIWVWNNLEPTTQNVQFGVIPGAQVDFESVLLHEMGYANGLGHSNLASESGLAAAQANSTRSTDGANNVFDVDFGPDGLYGSHDDIRGDDVNLHWFHKATNDPFDPANVAGVVDSTTYSVRSADLPVGDNFATNADRNVAALGLYGQPSSEAVMQQGAFYGETQRTLLADDVAGIRYAAAGCDELAGTADDYTLNLVYNGLVAPDGADIVIDFDNSETAFAVAYVSGVFLFDDTGEVLDAEAEDNGDGGLIGGGSGDQAPRHAAVVDASIYLNSGYNWYFNETLMPEPATLSLMVLAGMVILRRRREVWGQSFISH